ncbi:MAG: MaoC family dehydratase N-terminal domain-containing protein [Alphaproteobacteria bacterium]
MAETLLQTGWYWQDYVDRQGRATRTLGRTITETGVMLFVAATGMHEPIFLGDLARSTDTKFTRRFSPGPYVYVTAEALVGVITHNTALAFLGLEHLTQKAPVYVGDTLYVEVETIEARPTREGNRGIVRTRNTVINQRGEPVQVYDATRLIKGRPRPGDDA